MKKILFSLITHLYHIHHISIRMKPGQLILVLALVCHTLAFSEEGFRNISDHREAKWLFSSSSSKNSDEFCSATGGNVMSGVCRSQSQCSKQRGTVIAGATCSNKRVCCSFSVTCPANTNGNNNVVTVRQSGSHIRSANNPSTGNTNRGCEIKFPRTSKSICQVRLDFVEFNLSPPSDLDTPTNTIGTCVMASMTVNAENLNNFETCGNGKDQRLYLHYGESDLVSVNINANTADAMTTFDFFATFLPCSKGKRSGKGLGSGLNEDNGNEDNSNAQVEDDLAPAGCDQYYTGTSGMVKSFNYMAPSGAPPPQAQINNQMYTVCIRTPPGSKRIKWQMCDTVAPGTFFISGATAGAESTDPMCPMDYVEIPGSEFGRYCGGTFSGAQSTARPFIMYVNFDASETVADGFLYDGSAMVHPETGCPIGAFCVTKNNEVVTSDGPPGSSLPCMTNEGIAAGQFCMLDPALSIAPLAGVGNTGFCLQYTVTY